MKNEITPEMINAIKAKNPLAAIIGRYAQGEKQIHGRTWWLCPFHQEKTPSFSLIPNGQAFVCFGCGAKGDVIDFIGRTEGLKFNEAVAFLTNGENPMPVCQSPKPDPVIAARREAERQAEESRRIKRARQIWREAAPAAGTVVERYLSWRNITIPVPPSIRFAPALEHPHVGLPFPCMVAAIQGIDREITAVLRTYLLPGGNGKAGVNEPRLGLGPQGKGAIRLGPATDQIGLAEGIETALSAMQLYGGTVWAAAGSRLKSVVLPDTVKHVVIYGDNGDPGHEAAEKAAAELHRSGRKVTLVFPEEEFGDFNDVLKHARVAA